ncbi:MAG: hypothetical protein AAF602_27120 [Myxococcota bacterium]
MWTTATTAQAVQAFFAVPSILMGLSHILQPKLWEQYFVHLRESSPGATAVITRTFVLEIWPATLVVVFHSVWSGLALVLTVYGHLLMVKCVVAMLLPERGMQSLQLADRYGPNGFRIAGVMLVGLGVLCARLSLGP